MLFLHRTLGRPLQAVRNAAQEVRKALQSVRKVLLAVRQLPRGGAESSDEPHRRSGNPCVQPARQLRVPTIRSTRRLSRTPIPGFPAQTPPIRQESDGNPGIQAQMVVHARQVTDTRATNDGRTGGQHSNGPTIRSGSIPHTQRTPATRVSWPPSGPPPGQPPPFSPPGRTSPFSPPGSRPSNAPRQR